VKDYPREVRKMLARILLLLSVLLMPMGMTPAGAAHRQAMASMPMGHCDKDTSRHGMKSGVAECTMACSAALPATDARRDDPVPVASAAIRPITAEVLQGIHPETATPPPKRS